MDRHTLHNEFLRVEVRALGAALNRVVARTPGGDVDLVLGHADDADRAASTYYLGALVGPTANRIAAGRFTLDGVDHQLATNDRGNSLHGGPAGFSTQVWTVAEASSTTLRLTLVWTDPTGGHPGRLTASITYLLDGPNLTHTIQVSTDRPTLASPCLHPYVNLAGSGTIADHVLDVRARHVLFTDGTGIPVGSPVDVTGTPFDLRGGVRLGDVLDADHPQIAAASGLDHAYVLDHTGVLDHTRDPDAVLTHPASGRGLEIWTDQPSLQVFTGAGLHADTPGLFGTPYPDRGGVALEAQGFPNAANRPDFPSTRIEPGLPFTSTTRWTFTGVQQDRTEP